MMHHNGNLDLLLCIVVPVYRSERYLSELHERLSVAAQKITGDYEIIFVDDGSPDGSLSILKQIRATDDRVCILEFSRNFGHHKAIASGLQHSKAQYTFLIDSDLEEPPESLNLFWEKMHSEKDLDVIAGIQAQRKGGVFERISGALFWKLLKKLSGENIEANQLTSRLMNRKFIDGLNQFVETEYFFAGISALVGFKQRYYVVHKSAKGSSTYTLRKKISLLVNAITSFSDKPIYMLLGFGALIQGFSFIYIAYTIYSKIMFGLAVSGWTSLICSLWFLSGLILFSMGLLGIYIAKIYREVKRRPFSILKNIYPSNRKRDSAKREAV